MRNILAITAATLMLIMSATAFGQSRSTGACCFNDSTCYDNLSENECFSSGGDWAGAETTCNSDGSCPNTGACCLFDNIDGPYCVITTESSCVLVAVEYAGHGTACGPNGECPNVGACCFDATGSGDFTGCMALTGSQCASYGGYYAGDGTQCGEYGNCPNVGACCSESNGGYVCEIMPEEV